MDRPARDSYHTWMAPTPCTLLVSNPPHLEVDAQLAAPILGLTAADVRLKSKYGVPEVWLASPDHGSMEQAAQSLRQAGLNVVAVLGGDLAAVPAATPVRSFTFAERGLVARAESLTVELSYERPLVTVYCTQRGLGASEPRRSNPLTDGLRQRTSSVFMTRDSLVGFGGRSSMALGGGAERSGTATVAFCDLYTSQDGAVRRLSVIESEVDFSGLGELELSNRAANLAMFVAEVESRFKQAPVDRRLVNMAARSRTVVGTPSRHEPPRKGFSFATEALSSLLGSLSPDLAGISQFDLSSRLTYLTRR